MSAPRPIPRVRRGFQWLPLDFSRRTPSPTVWRWMAAFCLFVSVAPLGLALPLGWAFALRVGLICALGGWRPHGLAARLSLLAVDFVFVLWWMFGGYPQSPTELALAIFVLGVSFKAMELRTVGDGYMASTMCFLAPFLALIQGLPAWIVVLSCLSIPLSLVLRSGMACIESGQSPDAPWKRKHWLAVVGMVSMTLPVALALFWVLPRVSSPFLSLNRMSSGSGVPDTMEPGSMDRLMQDPSTAMIVSFKGKAPDPSQMYWRTFVMSSFNGRTWFQMGLPPDTETKPIVPMGASVYSYLITLMPVAGPYVPVMDRALSITGDKTLQTAMLTYRSTDNPSTVRQFEATSAPSATLDAGVLSPVVRRANLMLPDGYNPRTRALVAQWRKQGYSGEKLVGRALRYFRDNMTYSYTPPLLGKHSVDELMFDTKEGFCEHFSSSFVFAMRAGGIPARVVSGYQGGRATGYTWEIRQLDAHAWAEVWLEKRGWVRVDPTFAVVRKRPAPPGENASGPLGLDLPWLEYVHDKTSNWFGGFDQRRQQDLFAKWKMEGWSQWFVAIGVGLIVMAWAFSAVLLGWRADKQPAEIVQWERFQRQAASWLGLGRSITPRQLRRALVDRAGAEACAPMCAVIDRWELWRYAGAGDPLLAKDIAQARRRLRSLPKSLGGGSAGLVVK